MRKLSAKQIAAGFGGKRRQKAQKSRRKTRAKSAHRARTKPNPSRRKSAPRKKKVSTVAKRKKAAPRRKNPAGEIIAFGLGNPARRRKAVATSKKSKKKAASSKHHAGRSKRKLTNRARRKNPAGLGRPMDWVKGGVGVIAGGVGTRVIPQLAGSANTGGIGYAMNAGVALALAWLSHLFTKDKVITASVAAGGFAALILRVVGDMTPYGQALSLSGFGDYMVSNFVTPQRMLDPNSAMWEVPRGWGTPPAIAAPSGFSAQSGADSATSGNNF